MRRLESRLLYVVARLLVSHLNEMPRGRTIVCEFLPKDSLFRMNRLGAPDHRVIVNLENEFVCCYIF